jgi:glycosyltransferase involved in cell wall biosynthesis
MDEPAPTHPQDIGELPSVSVVVPTYNRAAGLQKVVKPLTEDPFALEIVVVVDGCQDGSMEILTELAQDEPRLKPLWIPNSGEMGAREAGVKEASGEVVLMLDDDVLVKPGLVRAHAERHLGKRSLVVLGYMPTVAPAGPRPDSFTTRLYVQEYEAACKRYESSPESVLRHLWAGNMSMRRADALRVGLSTDAYSSRYHQDREFGIRCLKAGMTGVFDRELFAEHMHSRTLQAFRRDAQQEGLGRRILHEIHRDILGPMPADEFEQGLPAPLRAVVRASDSSPAYRAITSTLDAVVQLARRLRLSTVEMKAAKLLRRVEQRHGSRSPAQPG